MFSSAFPALILGGPDNGPTSSLRHMPIFSKLPIVNHLIAMSLWFQSNWYFWPAILRLIIFSVMTAGSATLGQLGEKSTTTFHDYGWVEWMKFWVPIVIAWLGVWLAFLDQTLAKLKSDEGTSQWKKSQTS